MRIGIYDPYLDTLGGGEKYILTAAECLAKKHQVEIFWDEKDILQKAEKRFKLDLAKVVLANNLFKGKENTLLRLNKTKDFDIILYLSDGSIPFLAAKKNILLFQHPVNWVKGKNPINRVKFSSIHAIICYSEFVKAYLDKTFPKKAHVLYPPVDLLTYSEKEKTNTIVTVGRFTKAMNAKKQEVLISAFKQLCENGLTGWELIVAGSHLEKDQNFVQDLKKTIKGFPITIADNVPFSELQQYYQKAKIYWHAAGFGEDSIKHPERTEHFGITTVEAMSAGAVPVVFNGGGQREIVSSGNDGFTWNTIEELLDQTQILINNEKQRLLFANNAEDRAKDFSKEYFSKKIIKLIEDKI